MKEEDLDKRVSWCKKCEVMEQKADAISERKMKLISQNTTQAQLAGVQSLGLLRVGQKPII